MKKIYEKIVSFYTAFLGDIPGCLLYMFFGAMIAYCAKATVLALVFLISAFFR